VPDTPARIVDLNDLDLDAPAVRYVRYEVPIDGQWHTRTLSGPIVSASGRRPGVIDFWTVSHPNGIKRARSFLVAATGQPLPATIQHVHTTHLDHYTTDPDEMVWHLVERFQ
jgi:hypothetical protein